MNVCKKYTAETYSLLFNDTNFPSHNPLRYRKNILKYVYNIIIAIDNQIRDEKLQHDINRDAAKILSLSSGKISKYEYLSGKKYCLLIKNK